MQLKEGHTLTPLYKMDGYTVGNNYLIREIRQFTGDGTLVILEDDNGNERKFKLKGIENSFIQGEPFKITHLVEGSYIKPKVSSQDHYGTGMYRVVCKVLKGVSLLNSDGDSTILYWSEINNNFEVAPALTEEESEVRKDLVNRLVEIKQELALIKTMEQDNHLRLDLYYEVDYEEVL